MNILSKKEILKVYNLLDEMYPDAFCGLNFESEFELLIATILSAQCTDKRVNIVTKELFKKYNTPKKILDLGEVELKKAIRSCGLSKSKASNIIKTCEKLVNNHNSVVPDNDKELLNLNGVGVKTKNVVLSVAFEIPRMPVDTHVFRVSNRIGLVKAENVKQTEEMLTNRFEKSKWIRLHHLLIFHGRNLCKARNPKCEDCKLKSLCLDYNKEDKNDKE